MQSIKYWLKKNWSTALMFVFFVVLLVSPDAKAWLMRQVASTGLLNSKIEEKTVSNSESGAAKIAENFTVKDEKGTLIHTAELKGKVVFINFWASWCPPCRAEFPSIQKFYVKYRGNPDIVFLTVNMDDDLAAGKRYLQKEKFNIPFLIPASGIPATIFSGSLPTTVVLDKSGTIRMTHAGLADYSSNSFYE